jgi:Mg2+-importing ATPase
VAIASLLVAFLPMLPLQILLTNILSDFPMIALATDTVEDEELRKPKSYDVKSLVFSATIFGMVSSVFDFILFALFWERGESILQTNWFILSIVTELSLIYSLRNRGAFFRAKRPSWLVGILSAVAAITVFVLPMSDFGARVFHFSRPDAFSLWWIVGLAAGYFFATEVVKNVYYKWVKA